MIHRQLDAIVPELDAPIVAIAEDQPEYTTIHGALLRHPGYPSGPDLHNTVVLAFRPDDEQRQAIAEGADLYVSLLTFGAPMQPIIVLVGKESASAAFNVRSTGGAVAEEKK